jgi:hypothetical protein
MALESRTEPDREQAEMLAIGALGFLAAQPEALGRFLSLTGIGLETLRQAAAEPRFLSGLLDFFLANEGLLVDYARQEGIAPEEIVRARTALEA